MDDYLFVVYLNDIAFKEPRISKMGLVQEHVAGQTIGVFRCGGWGREAEHCCVTGLPKFRENPWYFRPELLTIFIKEILDSRLIVTTDHHGSEECFLA